jgi:drug/metabolite transporter (DMT)-like permease
MPPPDWMSRAGRSLSLTGMAEVWAGLREEVAARSERSGLMLMVASAASFALMGALAKLLLPRTPTQAVVLSRGVLMTAVCVSLAARRGVSLWGRRPGMLLVRGLLGYGAVSCYFYSVQALPLGDAVLLQYSHPVFVCLMAPALLGERSDRGHWLNVLAALLGVALIVGPSGDLRGSALVGLAGSFLSGLAYLTVRELSRTEDQLTILVWFPLATIPGALVGTWMAGPAARPRDVTEIAGHLAVFACALAGQVALTQGLSRVPAARATAVAMSGPVFGLLFGFLFFGTAPTVASIAGTALVLGALWRLARAPYASRS